FDSHFGHRPWALGFGLQASGPRASGLRTSDFSLRASCSSPSPQPLFPASSSQFLVPSQIVTPQHARMVFHVARNDERERANTHLIAARDPSPGPRAIGKGLEKGDRRRADGRELVQKAVPRPIVGVRIFHRLVLFETRQRRVEAPRKPESAK